MSPLRLPGVRALTAIEDRSPASRRTKTEEGKGHKIDSDFEQLMLARKAETFRQYGSAICQCVLTGSTDTVAIKVIATLPMAEGSLYWTRKAHYTNAARSIRIYLIEVFSDGTLVKAYAEQPVTLAQGESLDIRYVPSCLWNSGGRIDAEIVSKDGRILGTISTRLRSAQSYKRSPTQ